ncbi:MAG: YlmC/YmxH family sporulation protein [Clostridia bacterium]|nr:YlmC/YmxH family sporulation protein [Clostridia bacterium]MBO7289165.1 YlmC/YmxH family sporulation protein [Clostridia bacterium]
MLKASDFKNKEVINLANSEKLGYINDFEICTSAGEISAIYVPEKQTSFLNLKTKYIRIPWNKIQGIGDDVILVNIEESTNID